MVALPGDSPPKQHAIPKELAHVLVHPHSFAGRLIGIAIAWVEEEWKAREQIRTKAVVTGWNPKLKAAYKEATLTTEGLAHRIDNVSLSKLRRSLADVGAASPGEIIRAARLCLAERLLRETRLMVWEVARRAGYSSEKHFATKFSLTFGCSPSEYRRLSKPQQGA